MSHQARRAGSSQRHRAVRTLRRGQRSFSNGFKSLFCIPPSKYIHNVPSIDSIDTYSSVHDVADALMQDIAMQPPVPRIQVSGPGDRNSTLDFLADYGSPLPPPGNRLSVISPFTREAEVEGMVVVEEEACELEAVSLNESDEFSRRIENDDFSTRPVSWDPVPALQTIRDMHYAVVRGSFESNRRDDSHHGFDTPVAQQQHIPRSLRISSQESDVV